MFKEYKSRPIIRKALKIEREHGVVYNFAASSANINVDGKLLVFKCYEAPEVGDYVCYLNDSDIYHCNAAVFEERNIVE